MISSVNMIVLGIFVKLFFISSFDGGWIFERIVKFVVV